MQECNLQLGVALDEMREAKKMSRARLAALTGISEKTIQRIMLGQVDPKFSQMTKITEALAVSPVEVEMVLERFGLRSGPTYQSLVNQYRARNLTAIAATKRQLQASLSGTSPAWQRQLVFLAELMTAMINGDAVSCRQFSLQLIAEYQDYDELTLVDFQVMTWTVAYVPYSQLTVMFHGMMRRALKRWLDGPIVIEPEVIRALVGVVQSAINSGDLANVEETLVRIQKYPTTIDNYGIYRYQQGAAILTQLINGERCLAEQALKQIVTMIKLMVPPDLATFEANLMQQMYQQVAALVDAKTAI